MCFVRCKLPYGYWMRCNDVTMTTKVPLHVLPVTYVIYTYRVKWTHKLIILPSPLIWFKRSPCRIEDFIFIDACTTFRCLHAVPTTEMSVMSFSEKRLCNEWINFTYYGRFYSKHVVLCKLFSSKESIDTPCTITVLESASCSTWSILTSSFCTVALLGMMIELFRDWVALAKVVCVRLPPQFSDFFVSLSISEIIFEVTHERFWIHSMPFSSKFFTLDFLY